jgi:hypothetical protein
MQGEILLFCEKNSYQGVPLPLFFHRRGAGKTRSYLPDGVVEKTLLWGIVRTTSGKLAVAMNAPKAGIERGGSGGGLLPKTQLEEQ